MTSRRIVKTAFPGPDIRWTPRWCWCLVLRSGVANEARNNLRIKVSVSRSYLANCALTSIAEAAKSLDRTLQTQLPKRRETGQKKWQDTGASH